MEIFELTQGVEDLRARFLRTQNRTDEIVRPLTAEDCLLSVTADTSPAKWHLGHTSWFFAKFLLGKFSGYQISPEFDFVFNSYYKTFGAHIPKESRKSLSRPGLEEVLDWRNEIRGKVTETLTQASIDQFDGLRRVLEMGIHHEEQHQELLLMDIKRNFFENPQRPRYKSTVLASAHEQKESRWVNVPSGLIEMGIPLGATEFHYDNESDAHQRWVDSFMLMSHPVSNGEFLHFIHEGGYETPRFWLSDGWDTVQRKNWQHPLYWENRDGDWWLFTLWGMVPLDLDAPVCHLSYYEADAYARFRGARLPTEFEWEAAARKIEVTGDFSEAGTFEPLIPEDGEEFTGIHGTVWEWTQSAYLPYPRFENFPGDFAEYNGKFMVNQMVLRGGSCVTPRSHYRTTYRNFYHPGMRWQFSGARLARDLA